MSDIPGTKSKSRYIGMPRLPKQKYEDVYNVINSESKTSHQEYSEIISSNISSRQRKK